MVIDIVLVCAIGRGGLEKVLTLVSNELVKRGYRVRVIQFFQPLYKEWKDTIEEFYVLNDSDYDESLPIGDKIKQYSKFIKENGRPDALIATHVPIMSYMCYEALLMNNLTKTVPIISWVHGSLFSYGDNSDKYLGFSDSHLAISEGIKKDLERVAEEKSVYLINNPVEINTRFVERDKEKLNIIYLGRLADEKKIEVILKALKCLSGKWQFNVFGDGVESERLKKLSEELNMEKNVIWHGWCDTPWDEIKKASVLVLSSEYEGFGMVLVEALSRGIPVVSSKTDGALNIVKEGTNGWLFDIGDYENLSKILNNIQNGSLKLPSKEECRKSVEKFSIKSVVDKFESSVLIEYKKKQKELDENKKILEAVENIKMDENLKESLDFLNNIKLYKLKEFFFRNVSLEQVKTLNKIAILNYNLEKYDYVLSYLEIAYEMDKKDFETLYNITIVLYNIGEFNESLKFLSYIEDRNYEVLELEKSIKNNIR